MRTLKATCILVAALAGLTTPALAAPSTVHFEMDAPVILPVGVHPAEVLLTASEERGDFVETTILLRSGVSLSYVTVESQPFALTEAYRADTLASLGK